MMRLCDGDAQTLTCRELGRAAKEGDAFALLELDRVGKTFGVGLANLVTMSAPDIIAVGGGVANLGEPLLQPMRKYADEYVFISGKGSFQIELCGLMDTNVPVGARSTRATASRPFLKQTISGKEKTMCKKRALIPLMRNTVTTPCCVLTPPRIR